MADGFKIGDGYVQLRHSLDRAAVKADVDRVLDSINGKIGIDGRFSRAQINRALQGALGAGAPALHPRAELDGRFSRAQVARALKEAMGGRPPEVKVDANFRTAQIYESFQHATNLPIWRIDARADVDFGGVSRVRKIAQEEVVGPLAQALGDLGAIAPEVRTLFVGLGAAAVALLTPAIGAAVSGGVTAGGVIGVAALGAMLLKDNDQVKEAAEALSRTWLSNLKAAAGPMIRPLKDALKDVQDDADVIGPKLQTSFSIVAQYIAPLAKGLRGAVAEFIGPFNAGLKQAKPVIDMLSDELPEVGRAIGQTFQILASHSGQGAAALKLFLRIFENGLKTIATGLGLLGDLFQYMLEQELRWLNLFAKLPGKVGDAFEAEADRVRRVLYDMDHAGSAFASTGDAIKSLGKASSDAASKVDELKNAFDSLFGIVKGVDEATIGYRQALADMKEALAQGKRGFDDATQAGRDHHNALLAAVEAARAMYDANVASGMGSDEASAAYRRQVAELADVLRAMGYTEAEIQRLIGKYYEIPTRAGTVVVVEGIEPAVRQIEGMARALNNLHDKTVYVTTVEQAVGQAPKRKAMGGLVRAAAGRFLDAKVGGTTVLAGESGTGGEYLIPLRGISAGRARSMAEDVGRNYGFSTVSTAGTDGATAAGPVELTATIIIGQEVIRRVVRAELGAAAPLVATQNVAGVQRRRYLSSARG
ncbi:MAG: hypothetical protein OEW44_00025 [Gemmatimonadota bacterium]|nr:hypothetical protein [Gemmatimonadota bacterium]